MPKWKPISIMELFEQIEKSESVLNKELSNFWNSIKIEPTKWSEKEFGIQGQGFWVVAIWADRVIWYNDIEDGFNISDYKKLGEINNYSCEQDELNIAINKLFFLAK